MATAEARLTKTVLIITDLAPHLTRASARIPGLVRYLRDFGWNSVILTEKLDVALPVPFVAVYQNERKRPLENLRKLLLGGAKAGPQKQFGTQEIGENRPALISRILKAVRSVVFFPDEHRLWIPSAFQTALQITRNHNIQAVISSSSPVSSHVVACGLTRVTGIPWLADLRDLWSQNHNYQYGVLRRSVERLYERRVLSKARCLVTVSEPLAERLRSLHRGKEAIPISNGYDPGILNYPPRRITESFTLTYTGSIYPGKQDPTKLLRAVRQLIDTRVFGIEDIQIRFYGPKNSELASAAEAHGLAMVIHQYGWISTSEVIKRQRESQILVFFNWEDKEDQGVYSGKIFEYLSSCRPIVATGGFRGDVNDDLLRSTGAGVFAPTQDEITTYLHSSFMDYKRLGQVPYNGDIKKIKQYSHRDLAHKYALLLERYS